MQALAFVLSKKGVGNYDPMALTLISMLGALLGHLVLVTFWRRWKAMLASTRDWPTMAMMTLAAVMGPFVGVSLNMIALRHAPAGVVATIIATMPVMILPFSILLHHERPTVRATIGAIVAVAGIAMLMLG
jgi:drug/metabolite transporter (DMT)-like permease